MKKIFVALVAALCVCAAAPRSGLYLSPEAGVNDSTITLNRVYSGSMIAYLPGDTSWAQFIVYPERGWNDTIYLSNPDTIGTWWTLWRADVRHVAIDTLNVTRSDSLVQVWFVPHAEVTVDRATHRSGVQ